MKPGQSKFELRARIAELESLIDAYVHATDVWVMAVTREDLGDDYAVDDRAMAVSATYGAIRADVYRRREGR